MGGGGGWWFGFMLHKLIARLSIYKTAMVGKICGFLACLFEQLRHMSDGFDVKTHTSMHVRELNKWQVVTVYRSDFPSKSFSF